MRYADQQRALAAIGRKRCKTSISELSLRSVPGMGEHLQLTVHPCLTVVVGPSGAGKSTLLGAISLFASSYAAPPDRLRLATIELTVQEAATVKATWVAGAADRIFGIKLIRPFEISDRARSHAKTSNFADLLQSVAPKHWSKDLVEEASWILGRRYTRITSYEVEGFNENEDLLPYFEVETDGVQLTTTALSTGELSVLCLLWGLQRMDAGEIALIEEPDMALTHSAQEAVLIYLAAFSLREHQLIISTHSSVIARLVSNEHVRLLERIPGGLRVSECPSVKDLCDSLGHAVPVDCWLFVEDDVGEAAVREALRRFRPDILQRATLFRMSSGDLARLRVALPFAALSKAVFIFDGDQRGASVGARKDDADGHTKPLYLPGGSPDDELRNRFERNVSSVAHRLRVDAQSILAAHARNQGADAHEWLPALVARAALHRGIVLDALVNYWVDDCASEFEGVAAAIADAVDGR